MRQKTTPETEEGTTHNHLVDYENSETNVPFVSCLALRLYPCPSLIFFISMGTISYTSPTMP